MVSSTSFQIAFLLKTFHLLTGQAYVSVWRNPPLIGIYLSCPRARYICALFSLISIFFERIIYTVLRTESTDSIHPHKIRVTY